MRWVIGAGAPGGPAAESADATTFETGLEFGAVCAAQAGLLADMDRVADALYARVGSASLTKE
jgi:hypothetical protein